MYIDKVIDALATKKTTEFYYFRPNNNNHCYVGSKY